MTDGTFDDHGMALNHADGEAGAGSGLGAVEGEHVPNDPGMTANRDQFIASCMMQHHILEDAQHDVGARRRRQAGQLVQ